MTFEQLKELVEQWAKDKGILEKATPLAQIGKTEEEVAELREALVAQNNDMQTYFNMKGYQKKTNEEIKDAIGDILVTLIIQAKMQNVDIVECLNGAYNIIAKRTGKMVNGTFVKDS